MILTFNELDYARFDTDVVDAFLSGKEVQYRNKEDGVWNTYKKLDDSRFGPWYYNKMYEWRVKPATIELEVETVVKTKIEIPAPFEGEVPKDSCYHRVYKDKSARKWRIYYNHYNYNPSLAQQHVNNDLVYLDADTAREAFKILNGE